MKIERTKAKRGHANYAEPKRLGQEEQDAYIENTLKIIMQEHNGIIQTKDVTTRGIHPEQLNRYVKKHNDLQKVARGIYMNADEFPDVFNILQTRLKKGVFSYETALFLHGLTDVTPFGYHMTFPQGYNNKHLAESGVIPSYMVPDRYENGVITMEVRPGISFAFTILKGRFAICSIPAIKRIRMCN